MALAFRTAIFRATRMVVAPGARFASTEHRGLTSPLEHAAGAEQEELLAELEGRQLLDDSFLTGPFGTRENPVVVRSRFDSRIVGCVGGEGDRAHDLLWHELRIEKPLMCADCGQVFVLKHKK